jgi:hypothetical protein
MMSKIVVYEMSARRHFSRTSALFEARATKERVLHLGVCAEYNRVKINYSQVLGDIRY